MSNPRSQHPINGIQCSELPAKPRTRWLIPDLLPYGALSFLIGDEGIGKSSLAYLLAGIVSSGRGHEGLGIQPGAPGIVLMYATEDDLSLVVQPAITANGGDTSNVYFFTDDPYGSRWWRQPDHIDQFVDAVTAERGAPSLIIIDNFVDALPPGVQQKNPEQLRPVLAHWSDIARRTGAAILGLGHTNRSNAANSRDQWAGSSEYRKASRVALMAKDNEDGETFTIGVDKANMTCAWRAIVMRNTTTPTPIHYAGEPKPVMDDIHTVEYVCESERSVRELVEDKANGDTEGYERSDCLSALIASLASHGGTSTRKAVFDELRKQGYSDSTAKRAVAAGKNQGLIKATRLEFQGQTTFTLTEKGRQVVLKGHNKFTKGSNINAGQALKVQKGQNMYSYTGSEGASNVSNDPFDPFEPFIGQRAYSRDPLDDPLGGVDDPFREPVLPPLWRELRNECLDTTALAPLSTVYGQLTPATRGAHSKEDIQLELDRMIEAGLVEQDREGRYKRR